MYRIIMINILGINAPRFTQINQLVPGDNISGAVWNCQECKNGLLWVILVARKIHLLCALLNCRVAPVSPFHIQYTPASRDQRGERHRS